MSTDKKNQTPLPGTANDTPQESGDHPDPAPTETTPAEAPVMDPDSKPDVSAPAQKKA
jgi:hypothetical protein